ncbi:MAG: STAS domain-containing protein [Syntrophomonas sp.]|nr:STAS domain-containing protein [Syntrophomonas sp.]
MKILENKKSNVTVIELDGRLDSSTSSLLEEKLLAGLGFGEHNYIIDFAQVDYISSAGLRVLLMAAKKSKAAGGKVVLSALVDNVKEVFDIAGFTSIFMLFVSQEEALTAF